MKTFPIRIALAVLFVTTGAFANLARNYPIPPARAQAMAAMLYQGILFRAPDPAGLSAWTGVVANGGYDALITAAGNFTEGEEFRFTVMATHKPRRIVRNAFQVLLGRVPSAGDLQNFGSLIQSGHASEAMRGIVGSPEFFNRHIVGGMSHEVCRGMAGGYTGICRSKAGNTAIGFSVTNQNNQCVASGSPLFQPAVLQVVLGSASANLVGIPGGVAIANTTLAVYGNGKFVLNGYNYAGKFNFSCN